MWGRIGWRCGGGGRGAMVVGMGWRCGGSSAAIVMGGGGGSDGGGGRGVILINENPEKLMAFHIYVGWL